MMRGVVEYNPTRRAKPPRFVPESSHTPVFEEAEIVVFLGSIGLEALKDIGIRRSSDLQCSLLFLVPGEMLGRHYMRCILQVTDVLGHRTLERTSWLPKTSARSSQSVMRPGDDGILNAVGGIESV
jgi:hypothetical protein